MSWDSYIDNLIAQSKDAQGAVHVDKACIIGLDGGGQWTTNSGGNKIKPSDQERSEIAKCFKSKDFASFMTSGIVLEGIKFQFLREEDKEVVYAKRKDCGSLTLQASKTAIVIAHCPEGSQAGNCNKAVDTIAEYLSTLNI